MARFWKWSPLGLLFATIVTIAPHQVLALTGNFVDPIIPQSGSCLCASVYGAYDWGCILQVLQNVINAAVTLGVILCVIWIAYAGFTLMLSGGSASAREQGKTRVANAVIGIIVILCAWLVVDFIMKVIYEPTTAFNGTTFGPWNDILAPSGDDYCIKQTTPQAITTGVVGILTGVTPGTGTPPGSAPGNTNVDNGSGTGACDPNAVQQGAAAGGQTISTQEANTFACIANYESGCGAKNLNYNWGKGSSAAGAFQILLGTNGATFDNNACDAAVGLAPGTPLNCKSGFSGGNPIPGSAIANRCVQAAANLSCSSAAAAKLIQPPTLSIWREAYGSSANDIGCVTKYYGS